MLVFIFSVIGAYHSLRTNDREFSSTVGGGREVLAPLYPAATSQNGFGSANAMGMPYHQQPQFGAGRDGGGYGYERKTQV